MDYKVSVIIEKDANGYYAHVPELPGCQSEGDTFEEVMASVREAIELYVETLSKKERKQLRSREIVTTAVEVKVA